MTFFYYLVTRLISKDRVERHFAYVVSLILLNSLIYIILSPNILNFGSSICNFWSFLILSLIYIIYSLELENSKLGINNTAEGFKFILLLTLMLTLLIYYIGSNSIQQARFQPDFLWDPQLINVDTFIFPFFPKGQLSLYLDTNDSYGVNTTVGKIYAELLQLFYVSYYFWGNFLMLYLVRCYYQNINKKLEKRLIYRLILMFLTAWLCTFFCNLIINLIFPAVSPRIYLETHYKNDISGLFLCDFFQYRIKNLATNTYSAFPSAHSAQSWLIVVITQRLNKFKYLALVAAIFISTSTIILRYHYFIDFLASFIVVIFGAWIGGFLTPKNFNQDLELYNFEVDKFDFDIFDREIDIIQKV